MSADAVAIIGMAVRFPGADSVEAFWRNLREGVESTTFFSARELQDAGVDPGLLADPCYVRANGVLSGAEEFDAAFFGMTARDAEITDPQHRVLLELAWTAFEHAGYDPARLPGRAGVFAGAGLSTYLLRNLSPNRALVESAGELALLLGNNKDFAPTRISYKLNLRGPSVAVNTACSTSLVAVHLACQSLLDFQCDVALAGGVSIQFPQEQGYVFQDGGIGSPDGRCRAFDARARGTVSGNGAGVVVLKRLAEALGDGDTIHAVIRGSAVNNDGAAKVGFTAPSVEGQAQVVAEALAVAAVEPREISYIEAHGTGTEMGDPIEVAALTEVFGARTADRGFCGLGSVKTNFGHLDEAAGVAGLVKTVLALEHGELPPSLHFEDPNPKIDFAGGPFYVTARLAPWPRGSRPRLAGVSSFGIGGTNAHVVLEEAPPAAVAPDEGGPQVLVLSARTPAALERMAESLAKDLEQHPERALADVAYTLALGRREFEHRRFVVARNGRDAAAALRGQVSDSAAGGTIRGLTPFHKWAAGGAFDWPAFYAGQKRRRVPVPTYPFERRRYWIEAPPWSEVPEAPSSARKRGDVGSWFYQLSWKQAALPETPAQPGRAILWLGSEDSFGDTIERLRAAGHRVTVADDFAQAASAGGCERLLASLTTGGIRPTEIVHAWSAAPYDPAEDFNRAQERGYLSVLGLVQALSRAGMAADARLILLTNHLADVTGDEPLAPARATLLGLAKVIPQEIPGLACRVVDVTGAASAIRGSQLASEITGGAIDGSVAYRGARRWVRGCEPLPLAAASGAGRLRERGVYLITGGLGGVGLIVAEFLSRTVKARLVLAARRGLGAPVGDALALERLAAVRRCEALGAEVVVEEADAADAAQMRAVVARAEARFGALHGVVHTAGLTAGPAVFNLLADATREQAEALFRPKAVGAEVLAQVLAGRSLDFCVLISSNASVLGGLGLGAYAASNAYLDLLAAEQRRRGAGAWVSTNWDGWPTEERGAAVLRVQTSIDRFAMSRPEAETAFAGVLAAPVAQVAVSSGDLQARLRRWTHPEKGERAAAIPSPHSRPADAGAYVAPRDETERAVAALWSELLGVGQVGADDNFFDLEGDSLLGTQVIARLERDFGVALSVGALFEAPTVAGLAERIRSRAGSRAAGGDRAVPAAAADEEEEGTL